MWVGFPCAAAAAEVPSGRKAGAEMLPTAQADADGRARHGFSGVSGSWEALGGPGWNSAKFGSASDHGPWRCSSAVVYRPQMLPRELMAQIML